MGGAHFADEALDEAGPETAALVRAVPLEPGAIVLDDDCQAVRAMARADLDDALGDVAEGVLERVGDELVDDDRDEDRFFRAGAQIGDVAFDLHAVARYAAADLRAQLAQMVAEANGAE